MRKEVLLAILAGVMFGLVVAYGIWKANNSIKSPSALQAEGTPPPSQEVNSKEISLTLAKPENNQVFTQNPVEISGLTKPGSWITISSESSDYLVIPDTNGGFTQEIDLSGGVNNITVVAIDEVGNASSEVLLLVYSTELDSKDEGE